MGLPKGIKTSVFEAQPNGSVIELPDVKNLSDRELLEDMVLSQRRTEALVGQFIASLATNPMFKMMLKNFGG